MQNFNHLNIQQLLGGSLIELTKGEVICEIHQKIQYVYWLVSGSLAYYTTQNNGEDLLLIKRDNYLQPIGWNSIHLPRRFASKITISSKKATLLAIPIDQFLTQIEEKPELILLIARQQFHLYRDMVVRQAKAQEITFSKSTPPLEDLHIKHDSTAEEIIQLLHRSAFLCQFEESLLLKLAPKLTRLEFEAGTSLFQQEDNLTGLYILINGHISIDRIETKGLISLRSISTPGFIVGWSSLLGLPELCNAKVKHRTSVYFIHKKYMEDVIPTFELYHKLSWLLENHLNILISRILLAHGKEDIVSTTQLIKKYHPRLNLSSPLHQVPFLLQASITKPNAYRILHQLNRTGTELERYIASNSLDLLQHDENEVAFVEGLNKLYEAVADSNEESPAVIRKTCATATRKLFQHINYTIEGQEHLPSKSGNIFIYNHLLNDPYYTLANDFQITLDSHFISTMVLDANYNDPGIRVVRIGNGVEFAHQNYYQKLGYINVVSGEIDGQLVNRKTAREKFYEEATALLKDGKNLIISPEGTSYSTEESPGPFKLGAFKLAEMLDVPIVPMTLCYFDKRIKNQSLYCKILPPFRLKEQMGANKNLKTFVKQYQSEFAKEVKRTIEEKTNLNN